MGVSQTISQTAELLYSLTKSGSSPTGRPVWDSQGCFPRLYMPNLGTRKTQHATTRTQNMATTSKKQDSGMENISNRSPWVVQQPTKEDIKFRLKSQAQTHLDTLTNKRASIKQLDTAFEVQIKLKDKEGNVIQRNSTFDSLKEAQEWRDSEKSRILDYKKENGSFDISYETMTLEQALKKLLEEHYKGKASYDENKYRVPQIVEWLGGPKVLLRDINIKAMLNFRKKLEELEYSASSIRNYFVVMTVLFKHAKSEWLFPIENPASGIKLPKPKNAVERYWKDDTEKPRLFKIIKKRSPWLLPIVELSLQMSFRAGELVPKTLDKPFGMMWEGVDFEKETIKLFQEKNDHKKKATETKGRTVPMDARMKEILLELYEKHPTKKGRIFEHSVNSVSHAFTECCRQAEPPITELTFHSLRKIATYNISKKVKNPMLLGKITGHRDIVTLNNRYYATPIEDLQAMIREFDSDDIVAKGLHILEQNLGKEEAKEFINRIRQIEVAEQTEAEATT